ncbi:MAG: GNAT family N-acetyltransferase [Ruminococcus sp.]|nr:GNAT family N-acetyltransferase [Ruminococcus sp.]
MIKLVKSDSELDNELLMRSLSGRKMLAYMKAYGPGYDFCRFCTVTDEYGRGGKGFMFIINSTLIICGDGRLGATEELQIFINMNEPFRIEGDQKILRGITLGSRYQELGRTIFELIPDENSYKFAEEFVDFDPYLPDVYTILSEGFPNIADFSLWYTDTSHRCRHGISRVFTYRGSTTASVVFDIGGEVLIGQVATKIEARGAGYAREFLKWLALWLNNMGKRAYLLALDIRVSFYKEIGFREVEKEIVLERIDVEKDSLSKGRLADEM